MKKPSGKELRERSWQFVRDSTPGTRAGAVARERCRRTAAQTRGDFSGPARASQRRSVCGSGRIRPPPDTINSSPANTGGMASAREVDAAQICPCVDAETTARLASTKHEEIGRAVALAGAGVPHRHEHGGEALASAVRQTPTSAARGNAQPRGSRPTVTSRNSACASNARPHGFGALQILAKPVRHDRYRRPPGDPPAAPSRGLASAPTPGRRGAAPSPARGESPVRCRRRLASSRSCR